MTKSQDWEGREMGFEQDAGKNAVESAAMPERTVEEPSALRRRERHRAEMRERLYEAAMRLLAERDFESVTVEMITEAADVSKGTFFNYFDNKEAVVGYRFEMQLQFLTKMVRAAPAELPACALPVGGPVLRRMAAIMHSMAERDGRSKRLARTLLALGLTNAAVRQAGIGVHERIVEAVTELIAAGQAGGELRDDISAIDLAEFMGSLYFGALRCWAQSETEEAAELHARVNRLFALAWNGLRGKAY